MFAAFLAHWTHHLSESVDCLRQGLGASLEVGDYIHAGYCASIGAYYRFYRGDALPELEGDLADYSALCRRTGDVINGKLVEMLARVLATLRGETSGATMADASSDEVAFTLSTKSILLYLLGNYDEAIAAADRALPLPPGFFYIPERCYYRGLAVAAKLGSAPEEARGPLLAELRDAERTFRGWAEACPANHAHRHALLAAELAAHEGRADAALDLYDRAIALASEQGFIHQRALGNELAAKFHLARGRPRIARLYMNEAVYGYELWGAQAKVSALVNSFPELAATAETNAKPAGARTAERRLSDTPSHPSASITSSPSLDVMSAMRATQALAAELELSKLIKRLMHTLVESAGAQRGALILQRGDHLEINAVASTDPIVVDSGLSEPVENSERLSPAIVQFVARSGEAIVLRDATVDPRFARDRYVQRARPRSLVCLALQHQSRVTGVLYLENNAATDAFNPARVELLQVLAVQGAISVENAKLYGEVRAATIELREANEALAVFNQTLERKVEERTRELGETNRELAAAVSELKEKDERLKDDLAQARGFQQGILPPLPSSGPLAFAALYHPVDQVGGDIYDVCELAPGCYRIFLADATGHGVQASLRTIVLKSEYDRLKELHETPDHLLTELNQRLNSMFRPCEMLSAACCFDVDLRPAQGPILRYANAANPDLLRVSGQGVQAIPLDSSILGVPWSTPLPLLELPLVRGGTLLAYSDGACEQFGPSGEMFDLEAAVERAARTAADPQVLLDTVWRDLEAFRGDVALADDVTLVAVHVGPG
jgi:serine phosphatase RsbU (regulator of sigma subunit)